MWDGLRVFVTGGAGVIGRSLCGKLEERGAHVMVGDRALSPPNGDWTSDLSLLGLGMLRRMRPDVVFHLAASFERTVESPEYWDLFRRDVTMNGTLLELWRDCESVSRVVFASSYLVYDYRDYGFRTEDPVALKEGGAICPRNLCGAAKLLHEKELEFWNGRAFSAASARIFRVYGRGSRDVISRWARAVLAGERLSVYLPGNAFDFIFADDVAEGLVRIAESDTTGPVNLGTGQARSVFDVIETLEDVAGQEVRRVAETVSDLTLRERSKADVERLQAITGWVPSTSLEEGIKAVVQHERERSHH